MSKELSDPFPEDKKNDEKQEKRKETLSAFLRPVFRFRVDSFSLSKMCGKSMAQMTQARASSSSLQSCDLHNVSTKKDRRAQRQNFVERELSTQIGDLVALFLIRQYKWIRSRTIARCNSPGRTSLCVCVCVFVT